MFSPLGGGPQVRCLLQSTSPLLEHSKVIFKYLICKKIGYFIVADIFKVFSKGPIEPKYTVSSGLIVVSTLR